MATPDELPLLCARCLKPLVAGRGDWYHVEIRACADPTPPHLDPQNLQQRDLRAEIEALLNQIEEESALELQGDVVRRLTLAFCRRCFSQWIEDPAHPGSPEC